MSEQELLEEELLEWVESLSVREFGICHRISGQIIEAREELNRKLIADGKPPIPDSEINVNVLGDKVIKTIIAKALLEAASKEELAKC